MLYDRKIGLPQIYSWLVITPSLHKISWLLVLSYWHDYLYLCKTLYLELPNSLSLSITNFQWSSSANPSWFPYFLLPLSGQVWHVSWFRIRPAIACTVDSQDSPSKCMQHILHGKSSKTEASAPLNWTLKSLPRGYHTALHLWVVHL